MGELLCLARSHRHHRLMIKRRLEGRMEGREEGRRVKLNVWEEIMMGIIMWSSAIH